MQVTITSNGQLQLSDDGKIYQPLSVEAVELLANSIPAAQQVADDLPIAIAIQTTANVIAHTDGGTYASMVVQNSQVAVACDELIFVALQVELFGAATPNITSFAYGPLSASISNGA